MRVPLDLAETTHRSHDAKNLLSHRFIASSLTLATRNQNTKQKKNSTEEKKLIRHDPRSTLPLLRYQYSIVPSDKHNHEGGALR